MARKPTYAELERRVAELEGRPPEARPPAGRPPEARPPRYTEAAQVQAVESLRNNESLLRALTENSPDAIYVKDTESRWLMANPAVLRIVGRTEEEALGRTDQELYADLEIGRALVENDRRLLADGRPQTFEETADTPGGRRVFLSTKAPWRDARGTIVGLIGISRDITDHKRTVEALRLSEEKFSLAFANNPAAISLSRLEDGLFLDVNDTWVALNGYSREEAVGHSARAMRIWPSPEAARLFVHALKEKGYIRGWEQEFHKRSGETFVAQLSAQVLTVAGERVILSTLVDITDRKRAEETVRGLNADLERRVMERTAELAAAGTRMQAERQRLYDVLETLPAIVMLLSQDHRVPFANRFFRERFGESDGRKCHEYLYRRAEPCEECQSFTVLESGHPLHWEWAGPDGRTYDIHDFPFTDSDGSRMVMEMGIDITERRQAEGKLQAAHAELEQRARQLRALAGELTLSEQRERRRMARLLHDHLQQLLVGAKFRAAILGRAGDELVRRGVEEIEAMLDGCIQASRSLTAELSPPILHEGGLVPGLEWLARWMADTHGLIVDLTREEDLPPMAEDVKLLLFESVRELLFNAVKHAHAGSVSVNVRRIEGQGIRITVSDTGTGFDPAALKKAGEEGGGFGLFSIRERLDLVGGSLEIDSSPGKGSRFMLTAPLEERAAVPAAAARGTAAEAPAPAEASASKPGSRVRVLLADDHAVVREGLLRLLGEEPDIEVVGQAADGQEAVDLAVTLSPDVILMDMSMPRLNGVEATRAICRDNPGIRIIGLSMFEESDRAQALREAGAVSYMSKSGPPGELVRAIRACMCDKHAPD